MLDGARPVGPKPGSRQGHRDLPRRRSRGCNLYRRLRRCGALRARGPRQTDREDPQGTRHSDGYPASPAPRPAKQRLRPPMPPYGSSPRPRSTPSGSAVELRGHASARDVFRKNPLDVVGLDVDYRDRCCGRKPALRRSRARDLCRSAFRHSSASWWPFTPRHWSLRNRRVPLPAEQAPKPRSGSKKPSRCKQRIGIRIRINPEPRGRGSPCATTRTGITQPQHNRRMVSMYTGTVRQISTSQAPSP